MSQDIDRMRLVARSYACLQGLRVIPVGAAMFVLALIGTAWWPWKEGLFRLLPIAVLLVGYYLAIRAGRYYERRFGKVKPTRRQQWRDLGMTCAAGAVIVLGGVVDVTLELPVSFFGLAFAGSMLVYWRYIRGELLSLHWLLAAVPVGISLSPLFGAAESGTDVANLLVGAAGAVYVVGGILDHMFLMSTLGPLTEEPDAGVA